MTRLSLYLLLPAAALAAACAEETTVPTQKDTLAELHVDQVVYGLEHVMTTNGVRKANLHGDTAYFRDSDSRVDLRGVKLDFFNETTGTRSGTMTSRTGDYDMQGGAMTARGRAVLRVQGPSGERVIESEELHYDVQGNRMWSDKATVMRENGRVVRGNSFQSDTRFQNVTVQSAKVSGLRSPAQSGPGGAIKF